jgi:hypothetical protein
MKNISIVYALLLLSLFACRKDVEELSSSTTKEDPPVITILEYEPEIIPVVATVFGQVVNESGNPIANALVRLENNNTTTDGSGRFVFKDITMNKAGTFLTVSQAGYFEGSHRFFPQDGSVNYCKIVLLTKTPIGSFVANNGGTVSSQEGIQLDFPPNSIVDDSGNTYNGEVTVFARWLDPTADNMHEAMPGDLQGIDADAELVAIASYGMMAVELESPAGAALNLGNNQKAKLTFPIPDELLNNAPTTIPLWSFYNPLGLWVEETEASKTNGKYVGEVSHFSWWNCDYPYPLIELSGTLIFPSNDSTLNYATICLEMVSTGNISCTYSDGNGYFSGQVPANEPFILTVYSWYICDLPVFTANVGPFSADTDLGDITLNAPNLSLVEVTGTVVDCANNPLTNGWVAINVSGQVFQTYVSDGTYSISYYNCNSETEMTVQATNITDLQQSDVMTYSITAPITTIPQIAACGNLLDEYVFAYVNGGSNEYLNIQYVGVDSSLSSLDIFTTNPANDHTASFSLSSDVGGVGNYAGDVITSAYFIVDNNPSGILFYSCQGIPCTFNQVNISEYGTNTGDYIQGSFSGNVDFIDNNQNIVTHLLNVEFRVKRD